MKECGPKRLLKIRPTHLSKRLARTEVVEQLVRIGLPAPVGGWCHDSVVQIPSGSLEPQETTFGELVASSRKVGAILPLRRLLEANDPFFPYMADIALESDVSGLGVDLAIEIAGIKHQVRGPGRVALVEDDLTGDVLAYRIGVVEHSFGDLRTTTRYFRAYLQSAISVAEAFIARHAAILQDRGMSEAAGRLQQFSLDARFKAWEELFAGGSAKLQKGPEWCQFSEIRAERNRIVHAVSPVVGYSVRDMARFLNYVRVGVGGLLFCMRRMEGLDSLSFIERLRSAPEVSKN